MKKPLKQILQFISRYKYHFFTGLILLLAFILRFYNFDMRWSLGNDDSRDIAIAHEALRRHELPLTGSFSSAGPFVFGPFFYWFLMISYFLFPSLLTIPWILTVLVSVGTVAILMYCGKKLEGNNLALIVGLLTATSPQLVMRSLILGQHTFVGFMASAMVLCLLLFLEKKKLRYAFLVGLFIGGAINFHYQAINLLIFLVVILFISGKTLRFKLLAFLLAVTGVILALAPLFIWDSQQQFANVRNLLDYFLVGQYRLYVPNSWRLFLLTYFPNYWAFVAGGYNFVALITIIVVGGETIFAIIKKQFFQRRVFLIIPFLFLVLLNRYYKGERSEGYLLYFMPFIVLFTSFAIFTLFKTKKIIGKTFATLLFSLILFGNAFILPPIVFHVSTVPDFKQAIDALVEKFPHQRFVVYDYKASLSYYNQPLSLLLQQRDLIARDGMPIGIVCLEKCPRGYPVIIREGGWVLVDLRKEKNIKKEKFFWINVNPENMYDDLTGWLNKSQLRSSFSFQKYLTDKFHF